MRRYTRDPFDALFTQFTWPLSLVRERACSTIAELVADPASRTCALTHLLSWLKEQDLESIEANGLLILLRAQSLNSSVPLPEVSTLSNHLSRPSVLSWLLIEELYPGKGYPLEDSLHHSGEPSPSFVVSPLFHQQRENLLPPIYSYMAETIEGRGHFPFVRQWAYEWDQMAGHLEVAPSTKAFDYWLTKTSDGEHYVASDPIMSEVYRSAYLRALARMADLGGLTRTDLSFLTALACPVDLDLWQLRPSARPPWWPQGKTTTSEFDSSIGIIWDQMADLWTQQQNTEWTLAEASGFIRRDTSVYEMEILGVFQKCLGPEEPKLTDVVDWYHNKNAVSLHCPNPLRCRGTAETQPLGRLAHESGDWTMIPAAQSAHIAGNPPRWQSWRISRHVWLPTPGIVTSDAVTFGLDNDRIIARFGDIEAGRWFDWTDGLSDRIAEPLPPPSGQALQMPRRLIANFAKETNSTFCWICRLTVYYRKQTYEEYSEYTDCRAFGASHVIKPRD